MPSSDRSCPGPRGPRSPCNTPCSSLEQIPRHPSGCDSGSRERGLPNMKCQFFAALLLAGGAACHVTTAPDAPWLLVEPTRARYPPGDSVTVSVRNVGPEGVGLATCDWTLQRMDASGWSDLGIPPAEANCGDSRLLI